MLTLYGLKTCDTCRKARKALSEAGVAHDFVDIRADAPLADLVPGWLGAVGADTLINKKSTTWRGLSEAEKAKANDQEAAAALLVAHPTLVKRPVIVTADGAVHVGWSPDLAQRLTGV